jgi:Na+-transporting NADH:ubiquinone oxidoreductase subunit NqrC
MDTSNWITIIMWVIGLAFMAGVYVSGQRSMKKDITRLETKVDKHNCFMERLAIVETKVNELERKEG